MQIIFPDLGILILRLIFGVLTFAHGYHKWKNMDGFMAAWGLSRLTATTVAVIQIVGSVLIILGCFTQIAAAANCVVNAAVLFYLIAKSDEPFLAPGRHSWSIGVAYFGMAAALTLSGGGAFAVDTLIYQINTNQY